MAAGSATETQIPNKMMAVVAQEGACVVVERPVPTAAGREILIQVAATSINRADTLQRAGKFVPPPGSTDILGLEAAGVVAAHGPDCELQEALPIGARVFTLTSGGGNAEFVTADERHVALVPEVLDWTAAGAVPETWLTAYQLLHFVGQVQAGDFVLVHAAGSGVGTAAIQLAVLAGAKPIAMAGSASKLETATRLGAVAIINRHDTPEFADRVKEITGGRGADVILDCVGGSAWAQNAAAAAVDARWVVFGLMGGAGVDGPLLRTLLRKRVRLEGTVLRARSVEYKARLTRALMAAVGDRWARGPVAGKVGPVVDRELRGLEGVAEGHGVMGRNENTGKIVVLLNGA